MLRDLAQPGDILFYKTTPKSGITHRLIAAAELLLGKGDDTVQYSHVSLLSTFTDYQYEAVWPKLRYSKVDWNDPCIEIWRCKDITNEQVGKILRSASLRLGEWYNLLLIFTGFIKFQHAEICTTYIQDCYNVAGIKLASGGDARLTPNALSDDSQIEKISYRFPTNF